MILKKQIKENITKALYDSSNVLASTYDSTTNDLTIIFKAGTQYKYAGVSKSDYMRFEIADSQGEIFNTHIKKYAFEKLEKIDATQILEEAAKIKTKGDETLKHDKRAKLLLLMRQTLLTADTFPFVEENLNIKLVGLKTEIEKYLAIG